VPERRMEAAAAALPRLRKVFLPIIRTPCDCVDVRFTVPERISELQLHYTAFELKKHYRKSGRGIFPFSYVRDAKSPDLDGTLATITLWSI
jgi:hypothetical protein